MKYIVILLYFSVLILSSCSSNDYNGKGIIQDVHFENCIVLFIINDTLNSNKEVVIQTEKEYETFKKTLLSEHNNDSCEFPKIDFNKYTLLGKCVIGKGCDIYFHRKFTKQNDSLYEYRIVVNHKEVCNSKTMSMNYVLVNKVNINSKIEFNVIQN